MMMMMMKRIEERRTEEKYFTFPDQYVGEDWLRGEVLKKRKRTIKR